MSCFRPNSTFHVKHGFDHTALVTSVLPAPAVAVEVFGDALPQAERYWGWLASAGVERGLIGPREVDRLWERHLVNSTAVLGYLPASGTVVDLGSGAGLPGIVLALLSPSLDFVLVEPMLRRTTFLAEVVADLDLPNVSIERARADEYGRAHPAAADAVVARAVAPLDRLATWAAPLLAPRGTLLAMKGSGAADEIQTATQTLVGCGLSVEAPLEVRIGASVTYVVRASLVAPERAAAVLGSADSKPRGGKRRRSQ